MVRRVVVALLALAAGCGDSASDGPDADLGTDAPGNVPPTAAQLRAKLATCAVLGGPYSIGSSEPATVSICGLPNAVFWKADLDVDCDGKITAKCNINTDPYFMSQTAASDSLGQPLDAAALPYVVIPGRSTRFDYRAAGLAMGSVFAVIYKDQVQYGVAGDIGPTALIGEASYRMAELLGIDPDPATGGTGEEVDYIAFTGMAAIAVPIEDHDRTVSLGLELATALVAQ